MSERELRLRWVPFVRVDGSTRGGLDGKALVILLANQESSGRGTSTFFEDEMPLLYPAELERAGIALGEDGLSRAELEGDMLTSVCLTSRHRLK